MTTILSRPAAGGSFSERASIVSTSDVALAADACGRLAALVPVGHLDADHADIATGIELRVFGPDGPLGTAVALPVQGYDVIWSSLVAVEGGFVAAWVEQSDATLAHLAYVVVL